MKSKKMSVVLTFDTQVLGTVPKDKKVYETYIASKASKIEGGKEEVATVQEVEERGWTGFHQDDHGLFCYSYMIRGFLKEAATALKAQHRVKNFKSKIDKLVFVMQRRLHYTRNGKNITTPDGVFERPLRAMTMQGPRVTLARSDSLNAGVSLKFDLLILDNNEGVNKEWIEGLFEYGQLQGLGQFRNGSFGQFNVLIG
ncbi:MAG: hypothetical protein KGI50_08165 [Patescibacteria group bacterium]|nr:hypothetical protein [Patescibacteria group bacterium]